MTQTTDTGPASDTQLLEEGLGKIAEVWHGIRNMVLPALAASPEGTLLSDFAALEPDAQAVVRGLAAELRRHNGNPGIAPSGTDSPGAPPPVSSASAATDPPAPPDAST
jgi:hypothetical protein